MDLDLVPMKRVAAALGVSRATLWRASRSNIDGFPQPRVVRARLFWRQSDFQALKGALDRFQGRSAFEREQRHAKACKARAEATPRKHKRTRKPPTDIQQPDLFGGPLAPAPGGAERLE